MSAGTFEVTLNAGTSPSATSTVAVAGVVGFKKYDSIIVVATLTGATGGTLDVYVQHSADGITWYDYVHFAPVLALAAAVTYAYPPAMNDNIVVIGTNTTPALAAGSVAGGPWLDLMRVLYVAGASTSAGAAQSVRVLCYRGTD